MVSIMYTVTLFPWNASLSIRAPLTKMRVLPVGLMAVVILIGVLLEVGVKPADHADPQAPRRT